MGNTTVSRWARRRACLLVKELDRDGEKSYVIIGNDNLTLTILRTACHVLYHIIQVEWKFICVGDIILMQSQTKHKYYLSKI